MKREELNVALEPKNEWEQRASKIINIVPKERYGRSLP
jgi:hypothetical protein